MLSVSAAVTRNFAGRATGRTAVEDSQSESGVSAQCWAQTPQLIEALGKGTYRDLGGLPQPGIQANGYSGNWTSQRSLLVRGFKSPAPYTGLKVVYQR